MIEYIRKLIVKRTSFISLEVNVENTQYLQLRKKTLYIIFLISKIKKHHLKGMDC